MAEKPQGDADRAADADRLRALEAKLAALAPRPSGPGPMGKYEQANLAWRMVIELVTGLGLGFVIGYGLDHLLGTRPFLMVLFIFLGLAAGVKSMMRTASELDRKSGPAPEDDKSGRLPEGDKPGPAPEGDKPGSLPDRDERD